MSKARAGDLVMYINNGNIAGKIKNIDFAEKKIILDKMIHDDRRNAFVLPENEWKVWKVCNERLPEYALQNGCVPVVIYADFGGFEMYDEEDNLYKVTDRHNPSLVKKAYGIEPYKMVYIPHFMVNHYRINEYDGCESVELLVDAYKGYAVDKILANGQDDSSQIEAIKKIRSQDIQKL